MLRPPLSFHEPIFVDRGTEAFIHRVDLAVQIPFIQQGTQRRFNTCAYTKEQHAWSITYVWFVCETYI